MPIISIVILTKNEEPYIRETLEAVFHQEVSYDFEVILIDSGSRDRTIQIAQGYPIRLHQIRPDEFGHGRTRNLGAQLAGGEYVVFLNGDATPKNNRWLEGLLTPFFEHAHAAGVYSRVWPRPACNPIDARDILEDCYLFDGKIKSIAEPGAYRRLSIEAKRRLISFHTISCAIKKSILEQCPFEDIAYGEDLAWSKTVLEAGYSIIYASSSEALHSHRLHNSLRMIVQRYFDDARLSQRILRRWTGVNLLRWFAVIAHQSIRDIRYIGTIKDNFFYKVSWMAYAPLARAAELAGILLGIFPGMPPRIAARLSLAEEMKRR